MPGSLKRVRERMFSGCETLESIVLGEGIVAIETAAFAGCTSLTSLTIPESVTEICENAFEDCDDENLIIYASADSYAATFAGENDIQFREI